MAMEILEKRGQLEVCSRRDHFNSGNIRREMTLVKAEKPLFLRLVIG